ncbi:MAG TPA: GNAT family N-acetyltransferase [Streptosporangiaceae bacterium]|nr:GNAT family N-acetyltransferase [Streptosporangiaceae bacterium]
MNACPPPEKPVDIIRFDPASATAAELSAYVEVQLAASSVDQPQQRAFTADWALASLTRRPSADQRRIHWIARMPGTAQPVGVALLVLFGTADSDLAAIDITVLPDQRRRGMGTALLCELAMAAGRRNTLHIENIRAGTAAQAFAERHGFAVAQRTVQLSVDLALADRARWQVRAPAGYRLERWTGAAPEHLLVSYAAARNAVMEAPHGDMSFTQPEWSPQRIRDEEATTLARNGELRVVTALHQQTGEIAGLTYLVIYQDRPELADQQDTAVLAAHRGNGLGVWIKAANLQWLAADRPAVRRVRTSNAAENEHMLRVNQQVGFRAEATSENREVRTADLAARLATEAEPAPPRTRNGSPLTGRGDTSCDPAPYIASKGARSMQTPMKSPRLP